MNAQNMGEKQNETEILTKMKKYDVIGIIETYHDNTYYW